MTRAPALDLIRGAAVIAVVVYHAVSRWFGTGAGPGVLGGAVAYLWMLVDQLWSGVPVFLPLSGYLIGRRLLAGRPAMVHYRRRAARIWPLYLVVLAMAVVVPGMGPPWWSHLTMTAVVWYAATPAAVPSALGPLWSVMIEEWFYAVAPAMAWLSMRRAPVVLGTIGLGCLALKVALSVLAPTWAYYFPLARADAIVWGILVAAVERADVMPPNAAVAGNRGAVAVVGVAGVVWFLGPVAFAVGGWALQFPVVDTAAAVGAAALVWLGRRAGGGGGFGGALDVTIRWCGWRCYGIYLLHAPALSLVETVGGVLAATVATAAAAELSWRWLESPILATEAACR